MWGRRRVVPHLSVGCGCGWSASAGASCTPTGGGQRSEISGGQFGQFAATGGVLKITQGGEIWAVRSQDGLEGGNVGRRMPAAGCAAYGYLMHAPFGLTLPGLSTHPSISRSLAADRIAWLDHHNS